MFIAHWLLLFFCLPQEALSANSTPCKNCTTKKPAEKSVIGGNVRSKVAAKKSKSDKGGKIPSGTPQKKPKILRDYSNPDAAYGYLYNNYPSGNYDDYYGDNINPSSYGGHYYDDYNGKNKPFDSSKKSTDKQNLSTNENAGYEDDYYESNLKDYKDLSGYEEDYYGEKKYDNEYGNTNYDESGHSSILLVATSYETDQTEIIDLSNPKQKCKSYPKSQVPLTGATGALIQNRFPVTCGGWVDSPIKDCYILGKSQSFAQMSVARFAPDSITLSNVELLVTGGYGADLQPQRTSDIVNINGKVKAGPDLPIPLGHHCFLKINSTTALLIGGITGTTYSNRVWFFNIQTLAWTEGPSLILERAEHSCGSFIDSQGRHFVVVTGGFAGKDTTEMLLLYPGQNWFKAWDLPIQVFGQKMVTRPDGQGVIVFGGRIRTEAGIYVDLPDFYQLGCNATSCAWSKLDIHLSQPRHRFVAFYVPSSWC